VILATERPSRRLLLMPIRFVLFGPTGAKCLVSEAPVAIPAKGDAKAASDRDGAITPRHHPANRAASRDLSMVSATNGRLSTHTTSAEDWGRAAFAASPTRPPANAAHTDRTLNPASGRPRSQSSSRRSGRANTAAKRVPRSPNRQQPFGPEPASERHERRPVPFVALWRNGDTLPPWR
jgi:hypothetical protein